MRRDELRKVIRAACDVIGDDQVIVMGSQAILAAWNERSIPDRLTLSSEADIAAFFDPEELKADEIMGSLGQDSAFDRSNGFYADGILSDGPRLPAGWVERLLPMVSEGTGGTFVGWCLEPHDLCASKLAAARPKDHEFVRSALSARLLDPSELIERLASTEMAASKRSIAVALVEAWSEPWAEVRRRTFRRARLQAREDLLKRSPYPEPPLVRAVERCGGSTADGPCRALRSTCVVHSIGPRSA